MLKINPYLSLALLLLFQVSCSDSNPDAPMDSSVHLAVWSNPAVESFHGVDAMQNGNDDCISCHGQELAGSGKSASCFECHFDEYGSRIPVGSDWTHGRMQHTQQADNVDTCNSCHDSFRKFDLPPNDCHDCHNHQMGQPWMDNKSPLFHGLEVDSQGLIGCALCHGDDYLGGITGVSCYECHFDETGSRAPVEITWTHDQPHNEDMLKTYETTCNKCHDTNRGYENNPPAEGCHDCHTHDSSPEWLLRSNHAATAIADPVLCQACHLDSYCNSCHVQSDPLFVIDACSSCHGTPPNTGAHSKDAHEVNCDRCHSGAGAETLLHYDNDSSAEVIIVPANISYDAVLERCTGTCHSYFHAGRDW